jgi:hypothetical protein
MMLVVVQRSKCFESIPQAMLIRFRFLPVANTATLNWTQLPDDWEVLRKRWEYSHAVRALLNLGGFGCLLMAHLKIIKHKS